MHDQPPQRRAPLAGGAGRREHDAADGEVEVGRRGDDRRVVAAELEEAAAEAGGDHGRDLAPHRVEPVALTSGTPSCAASVGADVGAAEHELR